MKCQISFPIEIYEYMEIMKQIYIKKERENLNKENKKVLESLNRKGQGVCIGIEHNMQPIVLDDFKGKANVNHHMISIAKSGAGMCFNSAKMVERIDME